MKTLIAAALAATALTAISAPAMAQPYGPPPPAPEYGPQHPGAMNIDQRIDWMQGRINHGRMDGALDPREAERCQAELNSIRSEVKRDRLHHWGQLRGGDRQHLEQRLDQLSATIHWMRDDGQRRPW